MITIEATTDESYIKSVFLNPTIYSQMSDDSMPSDPALVGDIGPVLKTIPGFFLKALVDGIPAGLFWLVWNGADVEAHTALLPSCRGRKAIDAARAAMKWVFENTGVNKITSYAWSDSPTVEWFCRRVGMSPIGREAWKNTRHGCAVDITYFQITREAFI